MKVRLGELQDIPRLIEMGRRFISTTKYASHIAVDEQAMEDTLSDLIMGQAGEVFVLEKDALLITGMIGVTSYRHPISGELFVTELFWWVEPEIRGYGIKLLREAERWARDRGARALQMIAPTPDVERIYKRLGYSAIEVSYQKSLV